VVSNLSVKIKSHNEYSLDPHKRSLARRAVIEFERSGVVKSLENARTSHELQTGSASVVVTTTSKPMVTLMHLYLEQVRAGCVLTFGF
jgi:hypothetical protein